MHIAIAGGGIAGLAAAVALARAGHRITLAERAAAFGEAGAGIQIGPNGVNALRALGVAEHLAPFAVTPERLAVRSGKRGRLLAEASLGAAVEARFGAPWLCVLRADLHRVLLAAAREAGAGLTTGRAVDDYRLAGNRVECRMSPGPHLTTDALLGADGIRSAVRARLLGDGAPAPARFVVYRGLVPAAAVPAWAREPEVSLWLLPGAHVVHYPVAAGSAINIVAMTEGLWQGEGWSAPAPAGEVAAVLRDAAAQLADIVSAPPAWLKWSGSDRPPASRWCEGSVCLLGDAAHPVLPCLAQGAVMALEDAVVLARDLPVGAGEASAGFARFYRQRYARTAQLWRESRRQAAIYHLRGPARLARDLALSALASGGRLLARSAWLYRWTP